MRIWPGSAYPLGASFDGKGANFAIYSENAISVTLLLYESEHSPAPRERIPLTEKTGHVWHSYLPDVLPGQFMPFLRMARTSQKKDCDSTKTKH